MTEEAQMREITASHALRLALVDIDVPQKWTRGKHRAPSGRVDASEALSNVLHSWDDEDEHPATRALRAVTPARYERLSDFNDAHTHAEVVALFRRAIRRAERKPLRPRRRRPARAAA